MSKLTLVGRIGFGIHGQVFAVSGSGPLLSIVKVFESTDPYFRERDVYRRLQELDVTRIVDCSVPKLLTCSDDQSTLWMTMVTRPFCLDFAAAYLDELPANIPAFGPEWIAEKQQQFGKDWDKVCQVLSVLREHGIHQTDVSPTNISV